MYGRPAEATLGRVAEGERRERGEPMFADVVAARGPRQSGREVHVGGTLQVGPQMVPAGQCRRDAS